MEKMAFGVFCTDDYLKILGHYLGKIIQDFLVYSPVEKTCAFLFPTFIILYLLPGNLFLFYLKIVHRYLHIQKGFI